MKISDSHSAALRTRGFTIVPGFLDANGLTTAQEAHAAKQVAMTGPAARYWPIERTCSTAMAMAPYRAAMADSH